MTVKNTGGAGGVNGGAEDDKDKSNHEENDHENGGEGDGKEADSGGDGSQADGRGKDRFKRDLGKLKDENKALKEQLKKRDEDKLKEENRWKDLAERNEKERDEAKETASRSESTFKTTLKYSKLEAAAIKAGIREDALDDLERIDFDDEVEVEETSSGRYLVKGADKAIERLKKTKSYMFKDTAAPKFNGGGGKRAGGSESVTALDVEKAAQKYGRNSPQAKEAWNNYLKSKQKPAGK